MLKGMETTFSISDNITEVLKNFSENGKIEKDLESERRHGLIWSTTVYLAILLFSVAVNLKVLCILSGFPKRRRRKATSILIAHMSTIAIFYTFYVLLLVAEHANAVDDFRGRGICETMTFLQNTLFGVFTFNIIAIIYERFRSFTSHSGSLLVHRLLLLIWIISLLLSIPSIFTIVYVKSTENMGKHWTRRDACKSVPLFGKQGASLVYEFVRFSLLHVFVVGYMTYALIKLRSKLRHLHVLKPSPNERMRRKVQSIRFIYIHFITFILVWLPLGTLLFVYRTLKRSSVSSSSLEDEITTASSEVILRRALTALFLLYMILNPFIYLLLIIDNPSWKDCLCCYFGSRTRNITSNCGNEEVNMGKQSSKSECRLRQENVEKMEMSVLSPRQPDTKIRTKGETTLHSFADSRISTVALTSSSVKEVM